MTSGVVLYILASFSLTSVLGIVALPGCNTSTIYKQNNDRIISVQNKLITGKKSKYVLQKHIRACSSFAMITFKERDKDPIILFITYRTIELLYLIIMCHACVKKTLDRMFYR